MPTRGARAAKRTSKKTPVRSWNPCAWCSTQQEKAVEEVVVDGQKLRLCPHHRNLATAS